MQELFPENIDHIEDFYRRKLVEAEEMLPNELWSKIEKRLDENGIKGRANVNMPFYKSPYLIGVAAVTLAVIIWIFIERNTLHQPILNKERQPIEFRNQINESVIKPAEKVGATQLKPTEGKPQFVPKKVLPKSAVTKSNPSDTSIIYPEKNTLEPAPKIVEEEVIGPVEDKPEKVEEVVSEEPKNFYEKLKSQQKDSVRDLFTKKKKK